MKFRERGKRQADSGAASHLHILESQILSLASAISTKVRQFSSNRREDTHNAFYCHVYININVCAATKHKQRCFIPQV